MEISCGEKLAHLMIDFKIHPLYIERLSLSVCVSQSPGCRADGDALGRRGRESFHGQVGLGLLGIGFLELELSGLILSAAGTRAIGMPPLENDASYFMAKVAQSLILG